MDPGGSAQAGVQRPGRSGGRNRRPGRRVLLWLGLAGLLVLAAVVVLVGPPPRPMVSPDPDPSPAPTPSPTATASPDPTLTATPGQDRLALGTLTQVAPSGEPCPDGADCSGLRVACPGVQSPASGELAVAPANGQPRGLVALFSGGPGTNWWSREVHDEAQAFLADLRAGGLQVVQVRWRDGWLAASSGEAVGPAALACRPATVIRWAYDQLYLPLGAKPGEPAACGFCVTGNSGGASQVSYALSHFGLEEILDAVVPTSGPPHAALVKGCLDRRAGYEYEPIAANAMDRSYGFLSRPQGGRPRAQGGPPRAQASPPPAPDGPCQRHDDGWRARFEQDGVATGGGDYHHPTTRVHFIFGGQDTSVAPNHGRDYLARLRAAGSPLVSVTEVRDMGHLVQSSRAGLDALRDVLLKGS